MADDTDEKQVESSEEPTSDASPAENEGTEEAQVVPTDESGESEAPEQSERAKSRQHELARKLKQSEEERETLKDRLAQFEPEPPPMKVPDLPFMTNKQTGTPGGVRELTQSEYEQEVARKASEQVDLRVGQLEQKMARREKRLNDIDYIERKYPSLKPGEGQDKQLTKKVIGLVKKATDKNPDLDVAEFVDGIMELREAGQSEGRENASAEMARNEAEAPITPDATATKTKATSDEEIIKKMKSGELSAKEARKYLATED